MKRRNDALTPVVSAILALLIVMSTMTSVLFWGIPYIEELDRKGREEKAERQFTSVGKAIEELVNSNPGNSKINTVDLEKATLSLDPNKKDRTIVMYSFSEDYNFTVSGLELETCFLAGTKVIMADGTYKNIEEIVVGDLVLSYDENTGKILPCEVIGTFHHAPEEMGDYYLVINGGLKVTPNHRFYSKGTWVYAGNLQVGDSLFSQDQDNEYLVNSIERIYERVPSYNLEVAYCHTYFVSMGDGTDVLVHNVDPTGGTWVSPTGYNDPNNKWNDEDEAYDEDEESSAQTTVDWRPWAWTQFIELTHNPMDCKWIRFKAWKSLLYCKWIDVDIHWDNGDYGVINGDFTNYLSGWNVEDFGGTTKTGTDKTMIRFYAQRGVNPFSKIYPDVFEFDFYWLLPTGSTYSPINVGETTATLRGHVTNDMGKDCEYRFKYGYESGEYPYSACSWRGSEISGDTFNYTKGCSRGKMYYYKAQIRNGYNSDELAARDDDAWLLGSERTFLTAPAPFGSFDNSTPSITEIDLTWDNGAGTSGIYGAYIEYTTDEPDWGSWTEGTHDPVDGADGYIAGESFDHQNLDTCNIYYYKAWPYAYDDGYKSDGSTTKPFGTPSIQAVLLPPIVSATDASGISKTEATLNGYLDNKDVVQCTVWFVWDTGTHASWEDYAYNTSEEPKTVGSFSTTISELIPGTTYYFRTVVEFNIGGVTFTFQSLNEKTFTTPVDNLVVKSPSLESNYKWRRGTIQTIMWAYPPEMDGCTINITWQREGDEDKIKSNLPIGHGGLGAGLGLWNWSIPLNQPLGYHNYTINISLVGGTYAPGYAISGKFSITELHDGILHNETLNANPNGGIPPTWTFVYDGDSFNVTMYNGQVTRAEVYWLDYGVELELPYTLSGAICIDLYDVSYWFGSIWLLDSNAVIYETRSSGGWYKVTMEKGGIILSYPENNYSYVKTAPSLYASEDVFSLHAVQTIGSLFSGSGLSEIKIKFDLYISHIREAENVYNLSIQFYGDNVNAWAEYFKNNYEVTETASSPNGVSLFYKPSASQLWFAFAHSSIKLRFN
jgi:hypothetical protein